MKKVIAFLLAFMMLVGVLFIFVSAEETTADTCTCGGSYGAWSMYATEIRQVRYTRACDSCGKTQTAKDISPMTVSYITPAIGANKGDTIFLSLYSVYYDSKNIMSADSITWSSTELTITNGTVCPTEAGTYKLTATSGSNTKDVYVIAKNVTDKEYVLFYDNFDRDTNGDGKTDEKVDIPLDANATINDYAIIQKPGKSTAYFQNGKLVLNALGNDSNQMRVLLPKWIGAFGDYKIDTVFTINSTQGNNTSRWFATMARVGNSSNYFPLWQAAVRQGAKSYYSNGGYRGIEISTTSNGTNWTVPNYTAYSEEINPNKYYTQTFEMMGTEAYHSINGTALLDTKNNATKEKPSVGVGYVGFHLRAALVYVDSIKIVVPIEDATHKFTDWETITAATCLNDGLDRRECTICGTVEERVTKGGHQVVNHATKLPTCTEYGYQAYETCSVCDYTTFNGSIDPLGHYFDREFHSIAHRGYSTVAPENTLPAYRLAAEMGFYYAECDIAFTKDGVAVLLHDDTIDRTSNGSGKISELTYAEIKDLDFGSWKSEDYAGTKIPTFEEFIALCKEIGLHPYIELKETGTFTQAQINSMVTILAKYDMLDNCSWISFKADNLKLVRNADSTARLGYLSSGFTSTTVNTAKSLRNGENEVFLDISYSVLNSNFYDKIALAAKEGLAIEAWTVDTTNNLLKLPMYVSGIASNVLYAEDYLLSSVVTKPTCGEQGYTTYTCLCGATKVADYVDATEEHTAKDGVCTECGANVYCANKEHNLEIISIAYANGLDKDGVKVVKCLDCDALATEAVANPIFTCLGYSVPENDRVGVAVTFSVDTIALNEYENATGNTVRYGAFAVSQNNIRDNEIFDANGNLQGGVICADVTEYEFNSFDIVITGFNEDQKDLLFAMGAFIAVANENSTEYSYIQNEAPEANAVYSFESYNSILSKMEGVE